MEIGTTEAKSLGHIAIHETVENILNGEKSGTVLDVPAGEGALAVRLTKIGHKVSCCDLYPKIFKLEDIEIKAGDLDKVLPYENDAFDYAVCVEGLEHIENPANAIREFARIIKPGGVLVISVPNIMNIEERLKWLLFGYTSHFKPLSAENLDGIRAEFDGMMEIALHVNPIGYSEVRYLLEKAGFELEKVYLDKPKSKSWAYFPVTAMIKLASAFSPAPRRRSRWTDELNSPEVLLGGNTLIFKAVLKLSLIAAITAVDFTIGLPL